MRFYLSIVFALVIINPSLSQSVRKSVTNDEQLWLGYFNQTRFTKRFGTWTDLHFRLKDHFVQEKSMAIARLGLTYYISDNVKLTAGYAYVNAYPAAGHTNISQPEHRPWQQIQWHQKYKGFNTMQWIRFEQRYRHKIKNNDELADGYNFNYRLRYNFMVMIPLKGQKIEPKSLFVALNDEIHINLGKEITYNVFDQNRAFAGLGYQFSTHGHVQLGYMNVFQQLPAGNKFTNINSIRLFVFHNLDFRKSDANS